MKYTIKTNGLLKQKINKYTMGIDPYYSKGEKTNLFMLDEAGQYRDLYLRAANLRSNNLENLWDTFITSGVQFINSTEQ